MADLPPKRPRAHGDRSDRDRDITDDTDRERERYPRSSGYRRRDHDDKRREKGRSRSREREREGWDRDRRERTRRDRDRDTEREPRDRERERSLSRERRARRGKTAFIVQYCQKALQLTRWTGPPPPRRRSPSASRSRSPVRSSRTHPRDRGAPPPRKQPDINDPMAIDPAATAASTATDDPEALDSLLRQTMGFSAFKSTQNTKVPGNNVYGVRKEKKTQYRQYMNRVGGFNRPLSPSR
ncbi:hypothetical protein KEM56_004003 [Ascosphaera pollenicola]|nr:hypothetical protein KEM56_004003 [Ascosphaera pollenicola]